MKTRLCILYYYSSHRSVDLAPFGAHPYRLLIGSGAD